jgi:hypothetical protein
MSTVQRPKQKPACQLHDRVNMIALPALGGLAFAGLLGWYDPSQVNPYLLGFLRPYLSSVDVLLHLGSLSALPLELTFFKRPENSFQHRQDGRNPLNCCWGTAGDHHVYFVRCRGLFLGCAFLLQPKFHAF